MKAGLIEAMKREVPILYGEQSCPGNNFRAALLNSKNGSVAVPTKNQCGHNFNKEHESENVFSIRLYKHTLMRYHKIYHIKGWFPARYIS